MSESIETLKLRREALLVEVGQVEKKIDEMRLLRRTEAIVQIKQIMTQYGLSISDLSSRPATRKSQKDSRKAAVKFRNEETGEEWSGRGRTPKWLAREIGRGKKVDDFRVE